MEPVVLITQGEPQFAFKLYLSADCIRLLHEFSLVSTPHMSKADVELTRFNDEWNNGLAMHSARENQSLWPVDAVSRIPDSPLDLQFTDSLGHVETGYEQVYGLISNSSEDRLEPPPLHLVSHISRDLELAKEFVMPEEPMEAPNIADLEQLVAPLFPSVSPVDGLLLPILDRFCVDEKPSVDVSQEVKPPTVAALKSTNENFESTRPVAKARVTSQSPALLIRRTFVVFVHTDHHDDCRCSDCRTLELHHDLRRVLHGSPVVVLFLSQKELVNIAVTSSTNFTPDIKRFAGGPRSASLMGQVAVFIFQAVSAGSSNQDIVWLRAPDGRLTLTSVLKNRDSAEMIARALVRFFRKGMPTNFGSAAPSEDLAAEVIRNGPVFLRHVYMRRVRYLRARQVRRELCWITIDSYDDTIVSAIVRQTCETSLGLVEECARAVPGEKTEGYLFCAALLLTSEGVLSHIFGRLPVSSGSVASNLWRAVLYLRAAIDSAVGRPTTIDSLPQAWFSESYAGHLATALRLLCWAYIGLARCSVQTLLPEQFSMEIGCEVGESRPLLPLVCIASAFHAHARLESLRLSGVEPSSSTPLPSWLPAPPFLRLQFELCLCLFCLHLNVNDAAKDCGLVEENEFERLLPQLTLPSLPDGFNSASRLLDPQRACVAPVVACAASGTLAQHSLSVGLQTCLDVLSKMPPSPEQTKSILVAKEFYLSLSSAMAACGRYTKADAYCMQAVRLFRSLGSTTAVRDVEIHKIALSLRIPPGKVPSSPVALPACPTAETHKWLLLWDATTVHEPNILNVSEKFMVGMLGLGIVAGQLATCVDAEAVTVQSALTAVFLEAASALGARSVRVSSAWIDFEDSNMLTAAQDIVKTTKNYANAHDEPLAALGTVASLMNASLLLRQFVRRHLASKSRKGTLTWLQKKYMNALPSAEAVEASGRYLRDVKAMDNAARAVKFP